MAKKQEKKKKTLADIRKEIVKGQESPIIVYDVDNTVYYQTRFKRLNNLLGGGVKKGGIIEAFGFEDSGKTSLSIALAADIQKQAPKDKNHVVMINYEKSYDYDWWKKLGLDTSDDMFTHVVPDDLEQGMAALYDLIQTGEVCCAIIDSVYAAPARARKAMMEKWRDPNKTGAALGVEAVKWGEAWTSLTGQFHKHGVTVLAVNQMREKIDTGGGAKKAWAKPVTTPRGHALKFYAWIRLKIQGGWIEDADRDGKAVKIRILKNKTSDDSRGMVEYNLYRGEGFDLMQDLVALSIESGAVTAKGGGNFYIGKKHLRGKDALVEFINETPKIKKLLEKCVDNFLKTGEVKETEEG